MHSDCIKTIISNGVTYKVRYLPDYIHIFMDGKFMFGLKIDKNTKVYLGGKRRRCNFTAYFSMNKYNIKKLINRFKP